MVLEPVASELEGYEVESTNEMLAKIDDLNEKLGQGKRSKLVDSTTENCMFDVSIEKTDVENTTTKPQQKFKKNDIRSFGSVAKKTSSKSAEQVSGQFLDDVERIRNKAPKSGVIPPIG